MKTIFITWAVIAVIVPLWVSANALTLLAQEFEQFNSNFDFTVQEYEFKDDGTVLMQAPEDEANTPYVTNPANGTIIVLATESDVTILAERIERLNREVKLLNERLDTQANYIRELRDWQKKAVADTPQTNEDYARMFSSVRHAHGMLQANLYTYIFNAQRGRVDPPRIRPRNYDFELPEQEPTPFPPPVVN